MCPVAQKQKPAELPPPASLEPSRAEPSSTNVLVDKGTTNACVERYVDWDYASSAQCQRRDPVERLADNPEEPEQEGVEQRNALRDSDQAAPSGEEAETA